MYVVRILETETKNGKNEIVDNTVVPKVFQDFESANRMATRLLADSSGFVTFSTAISIEKLSIVRAFTVVNVKD